MADFDVIVRQDDVIKEGWLVKQSRHLKEWRRRRFVLTSQYLVSYKTEGVYRGPTEAVRIRECSTVRSAEEDTGKENSFRVDSPDRVFYLVADSNKEKEAWIGQIGRQMIRPTRRPTFFSQNSDDYEG
mmetsp:Transcript_87129/g.247032  ORF Transcript_87129/g.247032 Transcript_87129/m.247032 type:complete len:128 (-) Transcript_87129:157-540(-)